MLCAMPLPPAYAPSPLSQATRLGMDPYGLLRDARAAHGPDFTLRIPGDRMAVFSDPERVKEVLRLAPSQFDASEVNVPINLGPNSLLFLDGDRHKRERKLLMPPLHGERITVFGELMARLTAERVDALLAETSPGAAIDLMPEFQRVTLSVIVASIFGVIDPQRQRELEGLTLAWTRAALAQSVFLVSMMTGGAKVRAFLERKTNASLRSGAHGRASLLRPLPWQRLADAKARVVVRLREELAACRAVEPERRAERSDILALLVDTQDEHGQPLDDAHIIDELLTLLVGGHETTATALSWAMHHLLSEPAALAKLCAELDAAAPEGPATPASAWTPERVQSLDYLGACIDESMRLSPIAPAVGRRVVGPTTIGDYELPAGVVAWASIYLVHHDPAVWGEDAEAFRPERFLDGGRFKANQYFPFGGGNRRCIGAAFANYEMRVILAVLLSRARFEAEPGVANQPVIHGFAVTPSQGVRVRIRPRSA